MASFLVFLGLVGAGVADFSVLLLHNNDMHARFEPTDKYGGICQDETSTQCYGGFARLHAKVESLRQEAASQGLPTIFLNAGDTYQGTPYYTFFKWPIVAKFVNMLGIDVMSLGNHEFDDGISGLVPYINNVTVPNVCCNLDTSLEPDMNLPNLTPSKILVVNGTKIGVIGYLTPATKELSNTGRLKILDEIISIRAQCQKLKAEGVGILIAVGHSGYTKDLEIAKEVEEIDLVVGGHSHTFLYTGTPPDVDVPAGPYPTVVTQASGKKVPVVQAFYATKYLGRLNLQFDDAGNLKSFEGSPILLSGDLPQDPVIEDALKPYEQNISAEIHRIIGYTHVLLDNNHLSCKLGECNMGNLITDAYVDYVTRYHKPSQGWTSAAIGINQAGGIRASIDTSTNANHNGSITVEDVMTAIPWGSKIIVQDMPGSVLQEALEFSMSEYEDTVTGHVSEFLQVSGIHVVYNVSKAKGQRVVSVEVLCASCPVPSYQPLNHTQIYGVVMPEYIGSGGDGFAMFKNQTTVYVLEDVDYVVVNKYIEAHSPIYPVVEGRITIQGTPSKSAASTTSPSLINWFIFSFISVSMYNIV